MAHDAADFLSAPVHNLADESGRMIGAVRVIVGCPEKLGHKTKGLCQS